MNYLVGFLIFIVVLFTYVHITQQYKRSEDLEIYEMDYATNTQLQEICDVKQPVIFEFETVLPTIFQNTDLENICNKYGQEMLNIKDTNDYYKSDKDSSINSVRINCSNAHNLFLNNTGSHYYTENNGEFLEETGLAVKIQTADEYLKPTFTVNTKYDYISGSAKTRTPLRYHFDYRHYYIVTSGKITVKMTPWKSCKYLHPIKDYDTYEFRSTYNAWEQPAVEMEKVRFLEYSVEKGCVLYIPPYWWYSIQFADNTSIYAITYNSLMNVVAYLPQWVLYFIQQQNIYKKVAKTVELSDTASNSEKKDKESENPVREAPDSGQIQSI
uniref:Cupin-like domain-containing protein n=1 Tax=viral metagenome TaxID=1070528 RepID=A0A6C0HI30_9ZZZZ